MTHEVFPPWGVIFDMDGLMVDSEPLHYQAQDEVLKKRGHRMSMEVKRQTMGRSLKETVEIIKNHFGLKEETERLMEERQAIFLKLAQSKLELKPGLINLLSNLREHNARLAVASSQQRGYIHWALEHFYLGPYFKAVMTAEDVGGHSKPDSTIFLKAAQAMEVEAAKLSVLEDAVNGIIAAKAAGMRAIAVYDVRFNSAESFNMADVVVQSLEELTLKDFL